MHRSRVVRVQGLTSKEDSTCHWPRKDLGFSPVRPDTQICIRPQGKRIRTPTLDNDISWLGDGVPNDSGQLFAKPCNNDLIRQILNFMGGCPTTKCPSENMLSRKKQL